MDAETLISLLIALAISAALWLWRKKWERRADGRDHVAGVSRAVVIPRDCVGCRSPRATHPLKVGAFFVGPIPYAQLLDERCKRSYTFHCCLQCARPVLRRRRIGVIIASIGIILFSAGFAFIALLEFSPAFVASVRTVGRTFPLYALVFVLASGIAWSVIGLWMRAYSPFVRVLDGGGDTVFFHFRSQSFRNQFAQENGVP